MYRFFCEDSFFGNRLLLGHSKSCWVSSVKPFAKYFLNRGCVFSYSKLAFSLKKFLNFLFRLFFENRTASVFFVNGLPFDNLFMKEDLGFERIFKNFLGNYVLRWVPGLFSNRRFVLRNYRKRSRSLQRKYGRFSGLNLYTRIPSISIFFSSAYFFTWSIKEVTDCSIPTSGIVDSDSHFSNLSFPIFGNDDCVFTILFYTRLYSDAILRGVSNCLFSEQYVLMPLHPHIVSYRKERRKYTILSTGRKKIRYRFLKKRFYYSRRLRKRTFKFSLSSIFLSNLVSKFLTYKRSSKILKLFMVLKNSFDLTKSYKFFDFYKVLFYLKLLFLRFNFKFKYSVIKYKFFLLLLVSKIYKMRKKVYMFKNISVLKLFFSLKNRTFRFKFNALFKLNRYSNLLI